MDTKQSTMTLKQSKQLIDHNTPTTMILYSKNFHNILCHTCKLIKPLTP